MKQNKTKNNEIHLTDSFKRLNWLQKSALVFFLIILMITTFPIVLILLVGLLPTITVMYTDRRNYDKQIIIGCFNLAGVFFYLFGVMGNYAAHNGRFDIINDVTMLIVMLGSAALGLVLYNELPSLYIYFVRSNYKHRIEKINQRLEKLSEEWGIEVPSVQEESNLSKSSNG